jgi:hypothetical protein
MSGRCIAPVAAAATAVVLALLAGLRRRRHEARQRPGADVLITNQRSSTSRENPSGAVRSTQTAELSLPTEALERIWSPAHLERLARAYWRFLSRVTLGAIHVCYSEHERAIVLLARPVKLLTFLAPEYELDSLHGLVRWRIAGGLLVARRGRDRGGYLQIEVRRNPGADATRTHLRVEVEVANFYPSIASGLGRRFYDVTQSRIHVIITRSFLRSLQRLDLAESRVRRLAP